MKKQKFTRLLPYCLGLIENRMFRNLKPKRPNQNKQMSYFLHDLIKMHIFDSISRHRILNPIEKFKT